MNKKVDVPPLIPINNNCATTWQNKQNDMYAQRNAQADQSLLPAWRNLGSLATHWAQMPRLIRVFAGHTGHFVGVVMWWLRYWY